MFKFSPDGKLLLTLGKAGGARDAEYFYQPNAVYVAPNGDIFVSEGHSSTEGSNARVLKFDKNGKFLKSWGKLGKGPGEFDQPHALAMDSKGRLFVGDRGNNRIQIFDQDGNFLAEWAQFSRPSGIAIDKQRQHLRRGLRIGIGESRRMATGRAASGSAAREMARLRRSFPTPGRSARRASARAGSTVRHQHQRGRRRRGRQAPATSTAPKSGRAR